MPKSAAAGKSDAQKKPAAPKSVRKKPAAAAGESGVRKKPAAAAGKSTDDDDSDSDEVIHFIYRHTMIYIYIYVCMYISGAIWGSSFSNKARRDQYKARKFRKLKDADKLPPSVLEAYERAKNTPNPRSSVTAIINSALERTESKRGARVMLDNQHYQEARVRPPTYLSSESEP